MESDWEVAEREARIEHMASLMRRGARPSDVREAMQGATRREIDAARKRARRHAA